MNSQYLTIKTKATGRVIRQSMNALLRANAIISGYKIPHAKHFSLDDNKKTITTNISLLILQKDKKRDDNLKNMGYQIFRFRDYIPTKETLMEILTKNGN